MSLSTDPDVRRAVAEKVLPAVGVVLTPEFLTCLIPRPREKFIAGGWQAGKSCEGAAELFLDFFLLEPGRSYLYWVIVPSYRTPPKELDYLAEWCQKLDILTSFSKPRDGPIHLEALGGQVVVETRTAENIPAIAGEPCDGVLVVEAGQIEEAIRWQVQGRVITRGGWITYTGTVESAEMKVKLLWYEETIREIMAAPSEKAMAFSLPSWANPVAFPGGRYDEKIVDAERVMPNNLFLRRFAGEVGNIELAVYPMLESGSWAFTDPSPVWQYSRGAGGLDYGETGGHMTALAIVTVDTHDIAVVREVWAEQTSDTGLIETKRNLLSQKYHVLLPRWGFDPQLGMAAKMAAARTVSRASREERAGFTYHRLEARKLLFDFTGPGVDRAFRQMQRVHRVRKETPGHGWHLEYARIDDDMVAAIENAVEVIDGKWNLPPQPIKGEKLMAGRRETPHRVEPRRTVRVLGGGRA